jgi:hypothetical protein
MADLQDERSAPARPLEQAEIERRLRGSVDALLAGRKGEDHRRLVPISAADLVRLAAPMTSRN